MLKAVRAIFGATLVMAAVSACSDDPLSEGREDGAYFQLNPTVAVVNAGGDAVVSAVVVNRYGGAIDAPVTGTPCNSAITADVDTTRNPDFEAPERFVVTGRTLGESCLIVSGGGLTDTITVRVVPAKMLLVTPTELGSGEEVQIGLQFLNEDSVAVTGFNTSNVTWSVSPASAGTIGPDGTFTAQSPGDAVIKVRLNSGLGASRVDSVMVTIVPGTFSGTFSPASAGAAQLLTIAAGLIPFDNDTEVTVGGIEALVERATADTLVVAVPGGLATGTQPVIIANMGDNQISSTFDINVTSSEDNTNEPGNDDLATANTLTLGQYGYGTVTDADYDDYWQFTVPATGQYNVRLSWPGDADIDIYWFNNGSFTSFGGNYPCATGANPEVCTVTLTAGVWQALVEVYTADSELAASTYQLRITPQ